jgi:TnpA family transposase
MPRIRDLKDQQLYRVDKNINYGTFTPLLNKTADLAIVEEQWETMIRVALSLKKRTAPAHVIVQRLTNSFPSDRLSKAFTNLGRIIKTEYILRYITDIELRRTVQLQLNKGEYRHKLPRWIFFADQGEFSTRDYEEIMNKASSLSFVSNAILYWNTIKINEIVESLKRQGESIDDETLSHILKRYHISLCCHLNMLSRTELISLMICRGNLYQKVRLSTPNRYRNRTFLFKCPR